VGSSVRFQEKGCMSTSEPIPFGALLRRYRAAAQLTQKQLAERVGLSPGAIAALERGARRSPQVATVELLADALALSAAERADLRAAARSFSAISVASASSLASAAGPHNEIRRPKTEWIPVQPTPMVDRSHEVSTILRMLTVDGVRLLTLVGPAGVGKTRLALAAAHLVQKEGGDRFPDGVTLVDLAPVRDPALALSAIMHAQGLQDSGSRPSLDRLTDALRDYQLLLVLDNVEQILPAAAAQLAELLVACPRLALLVTSRAPLQLRSEQTFRIAPLPVPDLSEPLPPLDVLTAIPSVDLFLQRARARQPNFTLNEHHAPLVARLTAQLDGLPLALELAAARTATLPLPVIVHRLGDRLRLLRWEAADAPARQQSLEAAVGWSFELLNTNERRLFGCLGVFAGRVSLDAVAAVAHGTDGQVGEESALEALTSLAEKSLVLPLRPERLDERDEEDHLEPSFAMLETVREYAEEQLVARGALEAAHRAHAHYFLALAEQAEPLLRGRDQRAQCLRLEREHDNLRAALHWLLDQDEDAEREAALRLAGALGYFWLMRGYHAEAAHWLQAALAKAPQDDVAVRARGLFYAGVFLMHQRDFERSRVMLEAALALAEQRGDGVAAVEALTFLGGGALFARDMMESARLLQEALRRGREVGDPFAIASALFFLGARALEVGSLTEAATLEEEAVEQWTMAGDLRAAGAARCGLAVIRGQLGDLAPAVENVRVALQTGAALRDRYLLRMGARAALSLSGGRADPARQAQLLGAVEGRLAQPDSGGIGIYERWAADWGMSRLRKQLEQGDWDAALRAGHALRLEEVAALALMLVDEVAESLIRAEAKPQRHAGGSAGPLTAREREVLRLVAQGLSSKAIGRQLFIAASTVKYYLTSVFNKLGVGTRAQAVAVAVQRGLL
jgi:predicted ATPase/DNA-binding CsgD family transcriptional regulator/transcriptional regulator with XRE-family HTH domain